MHHKRGKRQAEAQTLPANNLYAIMILLFIITSLISSYLTYMHSREVVQELTGKVSAQARVCLNKAPLINQSCNTTATEGVGYYCDVDATDPDNNTITFSDDTALFAIDTSTGEIIFTPAAGDVGIHNITITATDNSGCDNPNTTTSFTITITAAPGPPPPAGGGGGGGGGGGAVRECTPQWECTPWIACRPDGTTERKCYTLNNCIKDMPPETQGCIYIMPARPERIYPEHYLCDFDTEEECTASFGTREDWIYTYKKKNSTINIIGITTEGVDASIDDEVFFYAPLSRIKGVDVTRDEAFDFEYIFHRVEDGRAVMTVRLVRKLEIVRERPVFVPGLPPPLPQILEFVYENACQVFLIVLIMAAMIIYVFLLKKVEEKEEQGKQGKYGP